MGYQQDRKNDHWLKIGPGTIEEKRAKDMGGMTGAEKPEIKITERDTVKKPWECGDEGFEFGTKLSGEDARKPHSGSEPGKKGK